LLCSELYTLVHMNRSWCSFWLKRDDTNTSHSTHESRCLLHHATVALKYARIIIRVVCSLRPQKASSSVAKSTKIIWAALIRDSIDYSRILVKLIALSVALTVDGKSKMYTNTLRLYNYFNWRSHTCVSEAALFVFTRILYEEFRLHHGMKVNLNDGFGL